MKIWRWLSRNWEVARMTKAIRQVYGETLVALGRENEKLVVLDADVSSSTQTKFFAGEFPERFFNMGIAESNMVATAAGLARQGFVPFVNTFAVFMTSIGLIAARDLVCYSDLNVKLAGAYCGLSDALDGASHHATEDIAIMRSLANMRVLCPCDAISAAALTKLVAGCYGPCYLRLSREAYPGVYPDQTDFVLGGSHVVHDGRDATVIACGSMVHPALEAAERLSREGISVRVVDMYSIKPLDVEQIERCAAETGAIVTAEEHGIHGGLGSAVAEAIVSGAHPVPVERIGVQDVFTESGPYEELMAKYGLDAAAIVAAVKKVIDRKG